LLQHAPRRREHDAETQVDHAGAEFRGAGGGLLPRAANVGKKAAGRLLDGREWNEFPK
jgi:hypothetical protein